MIISGVVIDWVSISSLWIVILLAPLSCGKITFIYIGCLVEWLKCRAHDQHGLGSTRTILLCPWERHFMGLFPAWWSWQVVLNYSNISTKLLADSNILASPEAGRGNCLTYVLAPPSLSCESEG